MRQCHYNPRKRPAASGHQRRAKPKRHRRLETKRTVAKILRQPYTVPRACMVIRALPVLTRDLLTGAETFLDVGMHLTPSVTPVKQWCPVTGATYVAASNQLQTAQSLIRGTVRGILAQRQVTVRVAVTWAAHVDTCVRVPAVSAQLTRFWVHHSVRLTIYAVHRARQRVLFGTLSSLRRLATRAPRHMVVLELALRSALAHTATAARPNICHQQLSYQKFRTWAAMVTHKPGDRDKWLTTAMCGALQLARTRQYRSVRIWRQESLDEVRTCMSRWLMDHQAWLAEIAWRWYLVRDKKKRPASAVDLSRGWCFKRCRAHHSDTLDYIQLTGDPDPTDPCDIQLTRSPTARDL